MRRLELGARKRIAELHEVLEGSPEQAHAFVHSVLDGPLRCTTIQTDDGARFAIEGTAQIGRIFTSEAGVSHVASPRGFEALVTGAEAGEIRLAVVA